MEGGHVGESEEVVSSCVEGNGTGLGRRGEAPGLCSVCTKRTLQAGQATNCTLPCPLAPRRRAVSRSRAAAGRAARAHDSGSA